MLTMNDYDISYFFLEGGWFGERSLLCTEVLFGGILSRVLVLKLAVSESPAELVKTDFWAPPTFRVSDSLGLGWVLEICISHKFCVALLLLIGGTTLRGALI